jgi:hypothetical protein
VETPGTVEPAAAEPAEDLTELVKAPPMFARIALNPAEEPRPKPAREVEPPPPPHLENDIEEIGRPEGPLEERHIDPSGFEGESTAAKERAWPRPVPEPPAEVTEPVSHADEIDVESPPVPREEADEPERPLERAEDVSGARRSEPRMPSDRPAPAFGRRGKRRR